MFIEIHPVDRDHWPMLTFGGVDLHLHFYLHIRHLVGAADDFHARGGVIDERVERHDRENGTRGSRRGHSVNAQQPAEPCLARNGIPRKIGIAYDQTVAVAHSSQSVEYIRIQ